MTKRFSSRATACLVSAGLLVAAVGMTPATSSAASGLPTLTLALNGKSVVVGGTPQSGAVSVVTTVTQEASGEPVLIRLNPGVPFSAFAQAGAAINSHHGDLNYLDPYGSIVFDGSVNKGTTSSAETTLQPGNYFALDFGPNLPTPPHATFTVTAATHPASLPAPGATVQAMEFGFKGPSTLHVGELVRFENDGFLVHMIQGIGVKNAKAAVQVTGLLLAGNDNKAMKLATSFPPFAGPLSPGGMQQEVITAKPGVYLLACFMDTQDGREHTQLGMERTIRILK
jgi:hypothetical protein